MPQLTRWTCAYCFCLVISSGRVPADTQVEKAPPDAEAKEQERIKKWESQIAKFEVEDAKLTPSPDRVLFVGSSSIRLWDLKKSFGEMPVLNRGFGGSQLADSVYYADRLVVKHRPKTVVLYAGDNDLAGGKSPEQVAADFQAFVKRVHAELPETRILYIGVKPSIARWKLIDKVRDANRRIREICQDQPRLSFIDVEPPMLGADGQPRAELFIKDGLHMTAEGYQIWTELLLKHLGK